MTDAVYLCDCGHPKAAHHGSAYACRLCQRCTRFTPDIQRAAREAGARSLDEVVGDILAVADQINPESTSAELARVEQERDQAVARLKEMATFRAEAIDAVRRVAAARDLLQAELASARGELEQLREDLRIKAHMVARLNRRLTLTGALASDLTELLGEQGWQGTLVARDGGRYCERCGQEIERDHAYEQVPGTDWAELVHRHCPTSKEKSTHG